MSTICFQGEMYEKKVQDEKKTLLLRLNLSIFFYSINFDRFLW